MNVGLLYSRIRQDEKLILSELRSRGHNVTKIDIRDEQFDIADPPAAFTDVDVVLDRCLATSRSYYATQFFDAYDIPVINDASTADVCADKVKTVLHWNLQEFQHREQRSHSQPTVQWNQLSDLGTLVCSSQLLALGDD